MDAWGIDVVLTASQKGLSTPPGLSILVASQKTIEVFKSRKSPVTSYYASWKKWLPIMSAYEQGSAAYFATPPVNLIYAFHAALTAITRNPTISLEERFKIHKDVSRRIKDAAAEFGLRQLVQVKDAEANGMTALYFPEGRSAADVIPVLAGKGIVVAGGLHTSMKEKYFRIGHMGITAVEGKRGDVERIIVALKEVFAA